MATPVSRGSSLRVVDPVLSGVAQGYQNAELIGESLFPIIPAEKEAGHLIKYGKEAFKLYATLRPMRGRAARIDLGQDSIPFVLNEHSIEVPVDDREIAEQNANLIPLQRRNTLLAMQVISLTREKACADLAQTAANFGANTGTPATKWSSASATPIEDIRAAKEVIRSAVGRYPNTLVLGAQVFRVLQDLPEFTDRIKYTQRAVVTEEIIASVLGLSKVVVGKAVYETDAGVMTDLWGKNAVLAYTPQPGDPMGDGIPSFGYTPRRTGYPITETYREEPRLGVVYVADIFQPYITGADAGYLFTNVVA